MLLKNIDEDVSLIDKPAENSPSKSRLSTVTKVKNYIDNDKKYDERAESWHKKQIVLELKISSLLKRKQANSYKA